MTSVGEAGPEIVKWPEDRPLPEPSVLRALLPFLSESVIVVQPDGTVTATLGSPVGVLGYGERLGTNIFEYVHPHELPGALGRAQATMEAGPGSMTLMSIRVRHASGEWRRLELEVSNRLDDPEINGMVVCTRPLRDAPPDVTESKAFGDIDYEPLVETLVDAVPAAIVLLDHVGGVRYANRAACNLAGLTFAELQQAGIPGMVANDAERREIEDALAELARSPGSRHVEFTVAPRRKGEVARLVEADLETKEAAGRISAITVVLEDVTTRRAAESELIHQAMHDSLTGLPNRAAVLDALTQALADAPEAVVVAYCDLDRFKEVNDRFGHRHGDELLVAFARALSNLMRSDDLVARLGGDEFVVMSTAADDRAAAELCDRVRRGITTTGLWSASGVAVSVGCARGEPGDTARSVLHRADEAMYADKHARRHC